MMRTVALNLVRETRDAFRGIAGTFDRTIAAVHRAHAADMSIQINTKLTRGNLHEYKDLKRLMYELKPAMCSTFILVPNGRTAAADLPSSRRMKSSACAFIISCQQDAAAVCKC